MSVATLRTTAGARVRRVELALCRPRVQLTVVVVVVLWLGVVGTQVAVIEPAAVQRLRLLTPLPPLLAGLVLARLRPGVRTGPQLALVGIFFAVTQAGQTNWRPVWWLILTYDVAFTLLYYVILAHPYGRLVDRASRVVAGSLLLLAVVFDVTRMLFVDPAEAFCTTCPPDLNILLVEHRPDVMQFLFAYYVPVAQSVTLLAAVLVVVHFARGTTAQRRAILPLLPLVAVSAFFVSVLPLLELALGLAPTEIGKLGALQELALLLLPVAIVLGAVRGRGRRRQVQMGDLVLALTDVPSADRLQAAVSRALGDPTVLVGVWRQDVATYLGVDGLPLDPPDPGSGREATYLERAEGPLAVVVHDQALLDDPGLLASVTAAVRLAIENDRLQEEVLEQLREVQASRARIVEAAYAERKRLERDLHDGAQQRLVSTALALRMARVGVQDPEVDAQLDAAVQELQAAIAELRDLARGMYPAVLADEGLPAALWSLADRCPVPTQLTTAPEQRLPVAVEAAAYFVVAEALTNIAKYATATRVEVAVAVRDGALHVEVVDDGRGGATTTAGGGLAGLRDRVAALGGELVLDSPPDGGTRLLARLPVAVEAETARVTAAP